MGNGGTRGVSRGASAVWEEAAEWEEGRAGRHTSEDMHGEMRAQNETGWRAEDEAVGVGGHENGEVGLDTELGLCPRPPDTRPLHMPRRGEEEMKGKHMWATPGASPRSARLHNGFLGQYSPPPTSPMSSSSPWRGL